MITQAEKMRRCVICLRRLHFPIASLEHSGAALRKNESLRCVQNIHARSFSEKVNWIVRTMAQCQQIGNNEDQFYYSFSISRASSILREARREERLYMCLRIHIQERWVLGVSLFGNVNISTRLSAVGGVAIAKQRRRHIFLVKILQHYSDRMLIKAAGTHRKTKCATCAIITHT